MRVLAIYPGFDQSVNEMAMVWHKVCNSSETSCTVLANMRSVLKGLTSAQQTELAGNLRTYRFPSLKADQEVLRIAASTPADVIFCAVPINMSIARQVQKLTGAPIILHTEYFLDDEVFLRRHEYLGIPFLRPFFAKRMRKRLLREADRILCSNPTEFSDSRAQGYQHLSYLPWPTPGDATPRPRAGRHENSAAYIGSLSRGKGAATLLEYFSSLLSHQDDFRLQLVGPALDSMGETTVALLRKRFPGRVEIKDHIPRAQALQLLSESLFILSPGYRFGWGLISDAWATGTPVLALAEHYELKDGENCIIVRSADQFVEASSLLRNDQAVWQKLAAGGLAAVQEHSIEKVAERLREEISSMRPNGGRESLPRKRE
jgi:glycosyltransferase involved in cell wall biosynthesis